MCFFQRINKSNRERGSGMNSLQEKFRDRSCVYSIRKILPPPTSSYNTDGMVGRRERSRTSSMCFVPFFSGWTYDFSLRRRRRRRETTLNQNRWPARDSGLRKHRRDMGQGNIAKSCLGDWRLCTFLGGRLKRNMLAAGRRLINLSYCAPAFNGERL